MDYTNHGILQARILEWIVIPFCRGIFPTQGLNPGLPDSRRILYHLSCQGSPNMHQVKVKLAQSCPTLCDPMNHPVHGILQARILEGVAFPFCRGIFPTQGSNPGLPHCRWMLYQLSHQGSPICTDPTIIMKDTVDALAPCLCPFLSTAYLLFSS